MWRNNFFDVCKFKIVLKLILNGTIRAKDLVEQILTFSRQPGQGKKKFDFYKVVFEALNYAQTAILSPIEIVTDINEDSGKIYADPTQIHQVIVNLLTNAFYAMQGRSGQIILSLDTTDNYLDPGAAKSMSLVSGTYLNLSISDTGVGIEQSDLDKIFDPYYTTKPQGEGTGLGLTMVQGIVKRYKGAITISSEIGKGTIVHVYLPQVMQRKNYISSPRTSPTIGSQKHILFVDDDKEICLMIQIMLERLGYKVTSFQSPGEALETFTQTPTEFELIITDYTMPEMTGDTLIHKFLAIKPDVPILLCTGYSEMTDQEKDNIKGVSGFLMKPISKNKLADKIKRVLKGLRQL